jgi:phosphoserine phosphatase
MRSFRHHVRTAVCLLVLCGIRCVQAEEPDDSRIIGQILETRRQILSTADSTNKSNATVFLAFWDFDGTILKGDCTEGLKNGGQTIYPGLAQVAIEKGFSRIYPARGGFEQFWIDYTNMDARIGHWLAYPFVIQMLRGAKEEEVLRLSQLHFANTLSNYLMASSVKIIRALEAGGIESHIISASPDLFVKGAAASLGIPASHIHGIQVRTRNGLLTEELIYPVTWNIGKLERLKQITAELEHQPDGKKPYVLAGFGDSYNTDGPFLKFIATQSFPKGKPIAVFYRDGEAPEEYRGLFYQARHQAIVGEKSDGTR